MGTLIRGGRVLDPARGFDATADVLVEEARIAAIAPHIPAADHQAIDAHGLTVAPGLVDMHVHLREDIASATMAAVRGGFTSIASMADTTPCVDHPSVIEHIRSRAASGACRISPVAAVTKGLAGQELAPIVSLVASGAVALSDDPVPVANAGLLRRAMAHAALLHVPVIEHCEDPALSDGGVVHDGLWSATLGLRGIPAVSEAAAVARDLLLAEETGARLHIAHVSTAAGVRLIREAKRRGVRVTAEVTPHHLVLNEESVHTFDANVKVNPPLRGMADVAALREGIADGTIDAIAADHHPHAPEEKMVEFDRAPFGVVGLETALGIVLTCLVRPGVLTLAEALRKMSAAPASILGLEAGALAVGAPADLVVIDLGRSWTVDPGSFASGSRNTPFAGWELQGKAVMTIVGGEIKHSELLVEELA